MVGWVYVNTATGEVRPARCRRLRCPYCIRVEAQGVSLAIALARPERAVRFSLVGDTWQERRSRLYRVRWFIRDAGYRWEDCVHFEPNPRGTGHHAHLWQWGDYVPQHELQTLTKRAGMGIPYIQRIRSAAAFSHYGLKGVRYGLKGVDGGPEIYLQANGGRLVHASREFWRDASGRRISRVRGAVREARRLAYGEAEGRWLLQREVAA
jgi:hypothetical protein